MLKVNTRVKFEKYLQSILNLYEKTKDKLFDEAALKQWLEKGRVIHEIR